MTHFPLKGTPLQVHRRVSSNLEKEEESEEKRVENSRLEPLRVFHNSSKLLDPRNLWNERLAMKSSRDEDFIDDHDLRSLGILVEEGDLVSGRLVRSVVSEKVDGKDGRLELDVREEVEVLGVALVPVCELLLVWVERC